MRSRLAHLTITVKHLIVVLFIVLFAGLACCQEVKESGHNTDGVQSARSETRLLQAGSALTLKEISRYALRHSPTLQHARRGVEIEWYGIKAARAELLPKVDFGGGITKYRYPNPITPISGNPLQGAPFPEFDDTIYDFGVTGTLAIFKGWRLIRGVDIAKLKRAIAADQLHFAEQDLLYNIASAYYKILQLKSLQRVNQAQIYQLEAHRQRVEHFLAAGTAPYADLLKTDVELARARETALITGNSLDSTVELLRKLMGLEDLERPLDAAEETGLQQNFYPSVQEAVDKALVQRPDYQAVLRQIAAADIRVKMAEGRRLPSVHVLGDYQKRSGQPVAFKENWTAGARVTVPIFEGGSIDADIQTQRLELERAKEEERNLRLSIGQEVKDAYLALKNAEMRLKVTGEAIASAKENARIEVLRYEAGEGTTTDVIDAETELHRSQSDYCQAGYTREIAFAFLRKAIGAEAFAEEPGW